ncbi:MAG: restriction endonuclease [Verrucomicrobia bacterium]|nr:restriction endonuclease [Verrucomicrobiota bacterium]
MPIPDYQACMLPLLRFAADGKEHPLKEAVAALAGEFRLTDAEKNEYLRSGQQTVFQNRVSWARTYMKKAGLLASPRRGYLAITERGCSVIAEKPGAIDVDFLERFPEFFEFKSLRHEKEELPTDGSSVAPGDVGKTPHEALESAYDRLRSELAAEILSTIKVSEPALFEEVVVDLIVKMGYGGSRKDAGQAIGRRGDEGIDGIIKEDRLGLDIIYIQAKRWDATIGRPEIQKFAGALDGQRAKKGIFITTSDFSRDAEDYVSRIDKKIILIDGQTMARLMIDFGVGVTSVSTYEVKKLDSDYFEIA